MNPQVKSYKRRHYDKQEERIFDNGSCTSVSSQKHRPMLSSGTVPTNDSKRVPQKPGLIDGRWTSPSLVTMQLSPRFHVRSRYSLPPGVRTLTGLSSHSRMLSVLTYFVATQPQVQRPIDKARAHAVVFKSGNESMTLTSLHLGSCIITDWAHARLAAKGSSGGLYNGGT
jgi:hypothetical protein